MSDQNKSNKGPMNSTVNVNELGDIDYSHVLTQVERIGRAASRKSIRRTELERVNTEEKALLNQLLEENKQLSFLDSPSASAQIQALKQNISSTEAKMNSLDRSAISRAELEASNTVSRAFSRESINSAAAALQKTGAVQAASLSMNGLPYDDLIQKQQDVLASIRKKEMDAVNAVKGGYGVNPDATAPGDNRFMFDPSKGAMLNTILESKKEDLQNLAAINSAISRKKKLGEDPESVNNYLAKVDKRARGLLSKEEIDSEIAGGTISLSGKRTIEMDKVNDELSSTAKKLTEKFKELESALPGVKETLQTEVKALAEDFEKLNKAAAAGGGRGGGINNTLGWLSTVGGGFNAVANAGQQILINQRLQQTSNIAGFAGLANQQYDLYTKARAGDVASQLALGQFDQAGKFGQELKTSTNIVQGAYGVAGAAQVAAGGVQFASTLNPVENALSTSQAQAMRQQGILNGLQGGSTVMVVASDALSGASSRSNQLAGIQAQMQAQMAINAIPARQLQGLRDFYTGLDVVGQDMGSRASGFISSAASKENMERMVGARISPEQYLQMAQFGAQNIGSVFNDDQIYAARGLEVGGFGSMQLNMQRQAQLAGAGANNPKEALASVLSAAVTSGLDSSQAISMMVDNTAAMVTKDAVAMAAGVDTIGSAAALLATGADPNQKNREFALSRSASAQEAMRNIVNDTSVTYTGMVNTARISELTGLGGTDSIFAAQLSTSQIKSMQKMDPNKAKAALLNQGVNVSGNVSEFLKNMLLAQTEQAFTGSGSLAFGTNETRESLVKNAIAGKAYSQLSDEEKDVLGKIGKTSGLTGEEYYNTARGIQNAPNSMNSTKVDDAISGKNADDFKKQVDFLRTSGFKQLSEAAASASKELGGFNNAIKAFTELQMKYEKNGMANEKEFSTAGSDFAKDFKSSISKFEGASGTLERASLRLIEAAGALKKGTPDATVIKDIKELNKKMGPIRGPGE